MTGEISGIIKKNKGLCTLLHQQQGCIASSSWILIVCPHPDIICKYCIFSELHSCASVVPLTRGPWQLLNIPAGTSAAYCSLLAA